jgi:hypothetical protein
MEGEAGLRWRETWHFEYRRSAWADEGDVAFIEP